MMKLSKIIHILRHGADIAPDFIASARDMLKQLSGADHDELKDALEAARLRSDQLHGEVQALAADAAKKPAKAG